MAGPFLPTLLVLPAVLLCAVMMSPCAPVSGDPAPDQPPLLRRRMQEMDMEDQTPATRMAKWRRLVGSLSSGEMEGIQRTRTRIRTIKTEATEEWPAAETVVGHKKLAKLLAAVMKENDRLRKLVGQLKDENSRLSQQGSEGVLQSATEAEAAVSREAVESAKQVLASCNRVAPATTVDEDNSLASWKGYRCEATQEDLDRYLNYEPGKMCPNDWYFVQRLIFKKKCFALPRRRCISVTPAHPSEPLPVPDSLFSQQSLKDENVRWDLHQCKSFECLNTRREGDCRNCFNLTLESHRWKSTFRGGIPMKEVLAFKPGSIRLGLDVGGGTGSFAAHMALHGVTVLTTAFNVETVYGKFAGLPYMEAMAQRGVVPLHWPHEARLPLYDGVLDIIHSVNSIKYIPPVEFQELIYEWNRVLRAGGLLWFEMFYAPVTVMPTYIAIIERLPYKKLYWHTERKPDKGEREGEHIYLHCVLEKLPSPGEETLEGPKPKDMKGILEYTFG